MDYRIAIYGKNFYKEVKLTKEWTQGLLVGTNKECQLRFSKESFETEFVLQIRAQNGQWLMESDDNVYLKKQDDTREQLQYLMPLDNVAVCDRLNDSELFHIEFSIDFVSKTMDYDRMISCRGCQEVTIGGLQGCTIRLTDPVLAGDYMKLRREQNRWIVDSKDARYGILINGFPGREEQIELKERDIITINGFSFYWHKENLYTSVETELITTLPTDIKHWQKNHLQYPKFIRSARQQFVIPKEKVDILSPKTKPQESKKNLVMTMVPMLVSMGMMVMMRSSMGGNIMYIIMCIAMSGVSIVMGVINYKNEGVQYRKDIVKRENDYNRYIAEQEEKIQELQTKESIISAQKYPSIEEQLRYVDDFDARLFEKQKSHEDYLYIRIGEGTVPSQCEVTFKKQEYREVEDPLMDYPEKIHDKYEYIPNMPVTLDLTKANAIGFLGDRTHLYQMTKNLIIQFCAEHYYQDVKLYLLMGKEDKSYFEWARWFRNFQEDNGMRNFGYDEHSGKMMLEYLYAQLSEREKMKEADIKNLPTNIVFIYRSELLGGHPVSNYLEKASQMGFVFLFFEEYAEKLNPFCSKRVFLYPDDYTGYIQDIDDGEQIQHFRYPHVSADKALAAAMKMACVYVDEVSLESTLTKNITLYQLLGIHNVYDLNLTQRWANSKIYDTMAAPLGVKSGDEVVYLDLHEKYHGPHGLVAGTTGSGKSEILQSYILSMATLFHPYEVGFIIIDFKGGGMVNQFRELPHLNGAITNIDGKEINRSLSSIRAEIKKRQRLFAEYDVNHIDDYIRLYKKGEAKQPLPHLILIVDEFAELKSEQPEFMKELISTARIGRSLGVHLILATQKPSGVVNDQIWSNSKFKLCLKVQNQSDSNEVLKSPLAAEIREPGRAYLQVGNNEIFQLFQSAYSGAAVPNGAMGEIRKFKLFRVELCGKRDVIYEQTSIENKSSETQLSVLVDYISEYCMKNNIERLPDICLPALEEVIVYKRNTVEDIKKEVEIPLGIYDDPDNQYQGEIYTNIGRENTIIVGSSQMGKTNVLQLIIRCLVDVNNPEEVNFYILDFGSMILKNFESLKHVGGVVFASEDEKVKNLFKFILNEIENRKERIMKMGVSSYTAYKEADGTDMPKIYLLIDNYNTFKELYLDKYEAEFLKITRDGISLGINVIITNSSANGIGYRHMSNFTNRICLNCNDAGEYSLLFEHCRLKPQSIPGRAILVRNKMFYEVQIYQTFSGEREIDRANAIHGYVQEVNQVYNAWGSAREIPNIPATLVREEFYKNYNIRIQSNMIPLGVDFATIEPVFINLNEENEFALIGKDRASIEETLHSIINSLNEKEYDKRCKLYIMDNFEGKLAEYKDYPITAKYTVDMGESELILEEVKEILEQNRTTLMEKKSNISVQNVFVIINSRDIIEYISLTKPVMTLFTNILKIYKNCGIFFLYSDVDDASIPYGAPELMKRIKDNRRGILFTDINKVKIYDIGSSVLRVFGKPLAKQEAYLVNGPDITKIKLMVESAYKE